MYDDLSVLFFPQKKKEKMENKAMYLSTYEERENGPVYEEGCDANNLSKLQLYDEGEDTWMVRNTYTKYRFCTD